MQTQVDAQGVITVKRKATFGPLQILLTLFALFLVIGGGVSLFLLQNSLRVSREARSQASGGETTVIADDCTVVAQCGRVICTDQATAATYPSPNPRIECAAPPPIEMCYRASVCRRQATNNKCGFTITPEVQACLDNFLVRPTSVPTPSPLPVIYNGPCQPRPPCADASTAQGQPICQPPAGKKWCLRGDLNYDGKVDLIDYSIMMQNFLKGL